MFNFHLLDFAERVWLLFVILDEAALLTVKFLGRNLKFCSSPGSTPQHHVRLLELLKEAPKATLKQ